MANAFTELADRIIKVDPIEIMRQVMIELEDELVDLQNEERMYNRGVDADGNPFKPYAESTIKQKREKGQRHDHPTLNNKGDFYDQMEAIFDVQAFTFKSGVDHEKHLREMYGKIYGLTESEIDKLMPKIRPLFAEKYKQAILK